MFSQHVLIVEDSLVYRRLLSRMLTQWGYTGLRGGERRCRA